MCHQLLLRSPTGDTEELCVQAPRGHQAEGVHRWLPAVTGLSGCGQVVSRCGVGVWVGGCRGRDRVWAEARMDR